MPKEKDTISILHSMRKKKDKRIMHYKVVVFTLLGLMLIYLICFRFVEPNWFNYLTAIIMFGWLSVSIIQMVKVRDAQNDIDEFYLEQVMENNNQRKNT